MRRAHATTDQGRLCVAQIKVIRTAHETRNFTVRGGLTDNTGPEIDGPKKNNRLKMSDMKLADQIAGHAIAVNSASGNARSSTRPVLTGNGNQSPVNSGR